MDHCNVLFRSHCGGSSFARRFYRFGTVGRSTTTFAQLAYTKILLNFSCGYFKTFRMKIVFAHYSLFHKISRSHCMVKKFGVQSIFMLWTFEQHLRQVVIAWIQSLRNSVGSSLFWYNSIVFRYKWQRYRGCCTCAWPQRKSTPIVPQNLSQNMTRNRSTKQRSIQPPRSTKQAPWSTKQLRWSWRSGASRCNYLHPVTKSVLCSALKKKLGALQIITVVHLSHNKIPVS